MEAVILASSQDRSVSANKQRRSFKKNDRPLVSGPSENIAPPNLHGGILHALPPPSLYFSYPPRFPFLSPQPRQPPLLPLPIPKPDTNPPNRTVSCPPANRKVNNRTKDQSRTPKKSKPPKKAQPKQELKSIVAPANLPNDVSMVLSSPAGNPGDLVEQSGSVMFTISPPPSSLPLPTFFLRPKLSCNAEAYGVDDGATDDLRRILRLR